jgi:hypothetical protein
MVWLNHGRASSTMISAKARATRLMITDSRRNCRTSSGRSEPETFRSPTSRLRRAERAVLRFMKLMEAINKMKKATMAKMKT